MISNGLFSALIMAQERGEITKNRVFQMDEEQQQILKTVTKDPKKDIVIAGKKYLSPNLSFFE